MSKLLTILKLTHFSILILFLLNSMSSNNPNFSAMLLMSFIFSMVLLAVSFIEKKYKEKGNLLFFLIALFLNIVFFFFSGYLLTMVIMLPLYI